MRTFTAAFTEALSSGMTDLIILDVLEITHPSLATPIRIVNNSEDISVTGETYQAVGFEFLEPEETEEGLRQTTLKLNNVDQVFTDIIRSLRGDLKITAKCVTPTDLSADPKEFDNVEYELVPLEVLSVTYDNFQVTLDVSYEVLSHRKFPKGTYDPFNFAGMF